MVNPSTSDIISIHVPTRGTTIKLAAGYVCKDFNPRAHEGHDSIPLRYWDAFVISIHVPTRGTTYITFIF